MLLCLGDMSTYGGHMVHSRMAFAEASLAICSNTSNFSPDREASFKHHGTEFEEHRCIHPASYSTVLSQHLLGSALSPIFKIWRWVYDPLLCTGTQKLQPGKRA